MDGGMDHMAQKMGREGGSPVALAALRTQGETTGRDKTHMTFTGAGEEENH